MGLAQVFLDHVADYAHYVHKAFSEVTKHQGDKHPRCQFRRFLSHVLEAGGKLLCSVEDSAKVSDGFCYSRMRIVTALLEFD